LSVTRQLLPRRYDNRLHRTGDGRMMKRTSVVALFLVFAIGVCENDARRTGSNLTTPIPAGDCGKPELLANGRPSMLPMGHNLAIGLSLAGHKFSTRHPIKLNVWVDNNGDEGVGVWTCSDLDLFKLHGFDLFDRHGNLVLTRLDAEDAKECKTDPRRANVLHSRLWNCARNFPIVIPAHTCVTGDDTDGTVNLATEYDLRAGEYTLRLRSSWKAIDDLCEHQSSRRVHAEAGDITFTVIR
jgi:hypothetical protein